MVLVGQSWVISGATGQRTISFPFFLEFQFPISLNWVMEAELPKAAHSPSLRKLQSCSLQVTHRDPRLLRALTAGGTEGSRIQLSFKDNFVFKKSFEVIVLGLKKVEENHKSSRTSLQTDTAQPLMLTRGLGKGSVKEQGQW